MILEIILSLSGNYSITSSEISYWSSSFLLSFGKLTEHIKTKEGILWYERQY